jgi:hypothetical protein
MEQLVDGRKEGAIHAFKYDAAFGRHARRPCVMPTQKANVARIEPAVKT